LGPAIWLKAAQTPTGGDIVSTKPIATKQVALLRELKLTASKYGSSQKKRNIDLATVD
jgi:hypothetical protein